MTQRDLFDRIRRPAMPVTLPVLAGLVVALTAAVARSGPAQADSRNERLLGLARTAGSSVPWIAEPGQRVPTGSSRPRTPPSKRRRLFDAALERARAEKRMVLLHVYRTAGSHMYRAPVLDDYMSLAVFSDPDLAALIQRRFVPLRLYLDRSLGESLGVTGRRSDDPRFLKVVEPALLLIHPDGRVLHAVDRIRTFSPHWIRHVLKEALRLHPELAAPSPALAAFRNPERGQPPLDALVRLAEQQCLDGDEAAALTTLAPADERTASALARARELAVRSPDEADRALARARSDRAHWGLAQARALHLLRRGHEALPELDRLQAALQDASLRAEVALQAARIRMARNDLDGVVRSLADAPASSERSFLLGAAHLGQGHPDRATVCFHKAVTLGDAPWHARAAGVLAVSADTTPISPLVHGFTMFAYGDPAIYAPGVPATTEWPRTGTPAEARPAVARAAFDYLLAHQCPDGSWSGTRYAFWPAPRILPNVRAAITALAASAVLAWRDLDPARADAALVRAERVIQDESRVAADVEEEVYTRAYRMLYWVRKLEAKPEARAEAVERLNALARRAATFQNPENGFYTHEYENAFCTAAMLWSLQQARAAGAAVPDRTLARAVEAVQSARREDGTFVYGGSYRPRRSNAGVAGRENVIDLKNASARMPLCEGVLLVHGVSNQAHLARAFTVFLDYLDRLERVRKCDFHADGELGGFFFWHALFHASEVRARLQGAVGPQFDARLLDLVTGLPEIDGSFVDDHELGKCYGTAMGLLVLKNLERAR